MSDKLEMTVEQFAEAVAKENARLNNRIEKLEAALCNVTTAWDIWQKTKDSNSFTELFASICEAKELEGKPDRPVYKEGYRAVEEAMGNPSLEFWVERDYDRRD